jgi:hypothetical protein
VRKKRNESGGAGLDTLTFAFYLEDSVSCPTNLKFINNNKIQGASDVPQSILPAAGVQNFPQALLDAAGVQLFPWQAQR